VQALPIFFNSTFIDIHSLMLFACMERVENLEHNIMDHDRGEKPWNRLQNQLRD